MTRFVSVIALLVSVAALAVAEPDGPRWYYLGPFVQDYDPDLGPYWRAPEGTVGLVDLRGSAGGMGFFATDAPLSLPGYMALGTALQEPVPPVKWASWKEALGIPADTPNPGTLLDALWTALTEHADPQGVTRAPPMLPNHRGILELHLGGHSLIRSQRFKGVNDPAWPVIQARLQHEYRAVRAAALQPRPGRGTAAAQDQDLHRKLLTVWRDKLGVDDETLFIPQDLPIERGLRPETVVVDNFNRAGTSTLGPDWTTYLGHGLAIASNQAVGKTSETGGTHIRFEPVVSSADHYTRVDVYRRGANGAACGIYVRTNGSNQQRYQFLFRNSTSPFTRVMYTDATGTSTLIGQDATVTEPAFPYQLELMVNGSTLTPSINGTPVANAVVTHSTITGNYRGGLFGNNHATTEVNRSIFDDFEVGDLLPPGSSAIPAAMHLRRLFAQ